jgi:hypothetical protein
MKFGYLRPTSNQTLHRTGATAVFVIRTPVVGPGR